MTKPKKPTAADQITNGFHQLVMMAMDTGMPQQMEFATKEGSYVMIVTQLDQKGETDG